MGTPKDTRAASAASLARTLSSLAAAPVGLGCMLATLLIYSVAVTPFQRYANLADFVTMVTPTSLRTALVAALAAICLSLCGRQIPHRLLMGAGGILYATGGTAYCAMALCGVPSGGIVVTACGIAVGLGSCALCLVWGRCMKRYTLRAATARVALATALGILLGQGIYLLPEGVSTALFIACLAGAVGIPFALLPHRETSATEGQASVEPDKKPRGKGRARHPILPRLSSFLSVSTAPAIGLVLYALIMSVRGELIVEDYPYITVAQLVASGVVFGCMLVPAARPMSQVVYRGLIPIVATGTLAVIVISRVCLGGSSAEVFMVQLLYTLAATLTLATLAGVAHAAEFSSDLVFSTAVVLFCGVTRLGHIYGAGLEPSAILLVITCATALYTTGMVVHTVVVSLRTEAWSPEEVLADTPRDSASAPILPQTSPTDGYAARQNAFATRCDELAEQYHLTAREREILGYLAEGHTSTYVSDELLISPNTVRTHIHNIYRRLGVASREDVLAIVRPAGER